MTQLAQQSLLHSRRYFVEPLTCSVCLADADMHVAEVDSKLARRALLHVVHCRGCFRPCNAERATSLSVVRARSEAQLLQAASRTVPLSVGPMQH